MLNVYMKHNTVPHHFNACQSDKTVLDAVDGYHTIPLDQDSQSLTAFITEWGRFMYKHILQGFIAAGDIYKRQYDEIIKDIP